MSAVGQRLERHPVLTVFVVALGIRLVTVAVITMWLNQLIFSDAEGYVMMASWALEGPPADWPSPFYRQVYANSSSFLLPLTGLYMLTGPSVVVAGLYTATLGGVAAAATTRLALEVVEARWAIASGLVMSLLPSVVLWSSIPLKDSTVWVLLIVLALSVAAANRAVGRTLFVWYGAVAGVLLLLAHARQHTLVVAAIALVAASLAGRREWRWRRLGVAALLAIAIPWSVGMGPVGIDFVTESRSAREWRSALALEAETAVVEPSLAEHQDGIADEAAHLPRGVAIMLVYPPPTWLADGSPRVRLAFAEHLIWLPLLLLALIGLPEARRRLDVLLFPVLAGGGILIVYALASGNFGTAYRHRAEFAWVVAVLAGIGARRLLRGGPLLAGPGSARDPEPERA